MRIAVVDDEEIVRKRLEKALGKQGWRVETFGSGEEFLDAVQDTRFDVVLLDMMLPGIDGMTVLSDTRACSPDTRVIVITGHGSIDSAVEAVKRGAFHYLSKPLDLTMLRHTVAMAGKARQHPETMPALHIPSEPEEGWERMIGRSPEMCEIFRIIRKVGPLDCNILIQGESGTGKELVARSIHRQSNRRDKPFVAFSCAGFTEELIAAELFGYERGAFTGATATKIGLLETAQGGTIFMDEIGDTPLSMQAKLLRVIQEKQILRVGGNRPIELDVRFVAATNKNLRRAVESGRFREDLFFRLNVVSINLPTLAERPEDIPLLIEHCLKKYTAKFAKKVERIDPEAREVLLGYAYPGNVRELENIIERAVALAEGDAITTKDLPEDILEYAVTPYRKWATLEEKERDYIEKVLQSTRYNVGNAARILGLPRTTLWRRMKKYGLGRQ